MGGGTDGENPVNERKAVHVGCGRPNKWTSEMTEMFIVNVGINAAVKNGLWTYVQVNGPVDGQHVARYRMNYLDVRCLHRRQRAEGVGSCKCSTRCD